MGSKCQQTHLLGRELYGDRYYSLRYEDLLEHTWEEMSTIVEFPGSRTG